jgi:limonene-1,2-epoxide hydrolase
LPNDYFAIEQTQPFIEKVYLNHIVLLTYQRITAKQGRWGFEVRIQAITSDSRIILHKLNDPAPCDLRMWPRIRLNLLPNIRAYCQEKESQVIDISSIGAHIILYEDDEEHEIGAVVKMKFIFENGEIDIEGKMLRKWRDNYQRNHLVISFPDKKNINQFIY